MIMPHVKLFVKYILIFGDWFRRGCRLKKKITDVPRRTLGGNFGTGVRASVLKPTPNIYLVFEKKDLFIYLIEQKVYIFIYCSLIFIYPLCCL